MRSVARVAPLCAVSRGAEIELRGRLGAASRVTGKARPPHSAVFEVQVVMLRAEVAEEIAAELIAALAM